MHKLIASLLGIIAFVSLAGCTGTTQNQTSTNEKQIVNIGIILPMSGPASTYGIDALNAYTYVVDQFNASQSELQIALIVEDGKCEGKDATSAAQKLITIDKVQAIVGGFCSAETVAAGKIAQQYHIPMLSPASSAPEISDI
ncbi:MAG: ABC transporter substrate-binding protein [Candidatus Peribacteria bacterium]|nr:ABC transporter substrate-binding protein [Candidatus Peribacteria bacterium]